MDQINKFKTTDTVNKTVKETVNRLVKGTVLILLILPMSLNAAQMDCQKIAEEIKGKTYEYLDMDDDSEQVTESRFFNDYSYAIQTEPEVNEGNSIESHIAYLNEDLDDIKNIEDVNLKVKRAENGRCTIVLEDSMSKEFFEIIGTMDRGDVLWLGDKNSSGGEIFFSLEKQPEE